MSTMIEAAVVERGRDDAPPDARGESRPPIDPALLRRGCVLPAFETTAELDPVVGPIGQDRAVRAIDLALSVTAPGYNVFVIGAPGAGKHVLVDRLLRQAAARRPAPPDWCYVHDFGHPETPHALRLPAGRAARFAADVKKLVGDLRAALSAAFESAAYRTRAKEITDELTERPEAILRRLGAEAGRRGIVLVRVDGGAHFAPLRDGHLLSIDEISALPEEERVRLARATAELEDQLRKDMEELPQWAKEARAKMRALEAELTERVVTGAMAELRTQYADLPEVLLYFDAVRTDIIENAAVFREDPKPRVLAEIVEERPFQRYAVNVLVDHARTHGAPVVYDDHPGCDELTGRIQHRVWLGNLVSDFTLVRAGSLHRANGGFLVLDARKVLSMPHAWELLKRTLFSKRIRMEPLGRQLGLSWGPSLEPEPIPLDLKVVAIGDRQLFALLCELDPDVQELFKVVAEVDERVSRTPETELGLARLIAGSIRQCELRPFDRTAVALVVEEASRRAEDAGKLSTGLRDLEILLREADQMAAETGATTVGEPDVERALAGARYLRGLARERVTEAMVRGSVLVDTTGERVGQVNGLAVVESADRVFGMPARVTATVRVGDGKVIDIEREVELGGPLHSKGVLILSSYLAARYARTVPWSMAASIVMEQSYGGVEGDSASLAELCALVSAIGRVPVRQSVAVTGSVNQLGQVQAVGGVEQKVEGFFDLCDARGLDGRQGVIVPRANGDRLMLRRDVVAACAAGRFHVWSADRVDDALETLTGMPAGDSDDGGDFPDGTVNAAVMRQLVEFAVIAERFGELIDDADGKASPAAGAAGAP
jgi:lon-related putative ATP-dependent protease